MSQEGNCPGNRIGQKQYFRCVEPRNLEDGDNPNNTKTAGTDNGNDGRHNAEAHTTDGAYDGIHHAA